MTVRIPNRALAVHCFIIGLLAMPVWLAAPGLAVAQGSIDPQPVRIGDFPGFGRIVLDFPSPTAFDAIEEGDHLLIVFAGPLALAAGAVSMLKPPRNVQAIRGGAGSATIVLDPGARFRTSRIGNRVVIDVLDPAPVPAVARIAVRSQTPPVPVALTPDAPATDLPTPASLPVPSPPAPVLAVRPSAVRTAAVLRPGVRGPAVRVPAIAPLASPALSVSPTVPTSAAGPAKVAIVPQPAPVVPVHQDPLPIASASLNPAVPSPVDPAPPSAAPTPSSAASSHSLSILLPLDSSVGAAAFRRANAGLAVFDQRVPFDLATVPGGAAFAAANATIQLGQATTALMVPLAAGQALALSREPSGWRVTRTSDPATPAVIEVAASPAGLLLKLEHPGRVVTVADPMTSGSLLVGTVAPVGGAGTAIAAARRTPGYALAPTWLGVVIEPLADVVELRPASGGFVVISPGMEAETETPAQTTRAFTRRFDFPDLPAPALVQRLHAQVAAAAAAPPRARTPDRMAAAQSLLSLGLAAEAQALLVHTATEDPVAATDANLAGLMAIAALLAGRSAEAAGLDDQRLDGTDDVALWRGVRDVLRDADPEAGRSLSRLLPLASAYPAALRDRLRPLMIEAAIAAGQAASVATALAHSDSIKSEAGKAKLAGSGSDGATEGKPDEPGLDFARALAQERDGNTVAALVAYDALAAGRDQLMQVRAGVRAAELRLQDGAITSAQAADILERQAAIWRGDARESRMRLRAAELRTAAGAFRPALDLLRDTERVFPAQQPAIRIAMAQVFRAMLSQPQAVSPIDLVTIASDYAALLPNGAGGELGELLADKLVALDLPGRAGPVLATLMAITPPGPARARVGARLAQLHLDTAAYPASETALQASDAPGLPATLAEQRILLLARAQAGRGDLPAAVAGLLTLGTAAADDLRATLLSQAADWSGSLSALADLAAKAVPNTGPLTDAMQDIVLRQATSAVQANDAAALADLQRRHGVRLASPRANLFRLLTAEPLRSSTDLPRAAAELALARQLPSQLQALAPGSMK